MHLLVTIHAGLRSWKIRMRRDIDETVTVATIHPELCNVNIMRKRDGLDRLIADTRVFRRDVIPSGGG